MPSKPRRISAARRRLAPGCLLFGLLALTLAGTASVAPPGGGAPVRTPLLQAAAGALRSGWAGSAAGLCQVLAFMWLRSIMNHQYKHGLSFPATARALYAEGGVRRFYRGLFPWAVLQAPLSRFGDTAANAGALAFAAAYLPSVPVGAATLLGSCCGACWRVLITPVDTCKTVLQTDGEAGWQLLREKIAAGGLGVLWHGWEGNWAANVLGHYPWFVTVNILTRNLPAGAPLLRNAFIGAVAATVSDIVSNSVRVVKVAKQTSPDPRVGYLQAALGVVARDGLRGLFLRGLETRVLTNVLQGALFNVVWRGLVKRA